MSAVSATLSTRKIYRPIMREIQGSLPEERVLDLVVAHPCKNSWPCGPHRTPTLTTRAGGEHLVEADLALVLTYLPHPVCLDCLPTVNGESPALPKLHNSISQCAPAAP